MRMSTRWIPFLTLGIFLVLFVWFLQAELPCGAQMMAPAVPAQPAATETPQAPPPPPTPMLSYFPKASPTQGTVEGGPQTASPEEDARARVNRARSDCRTMATALESYYVDHNTYPAKAIQLTTPIAYITSIPKDPFSAAKADLKLQSKPTTWFCYSIGPDRKDNQGILVYDPSNGTFSAGDILRTRQ